MACDGSQLEAAKRALEGADALMLQLEIPMDVSLAAAQHAKSKGIRVIWDPAPAAELPPEAFRAADVMTPNQTEAAVLTGIEVTDIDSARAAARALLEKGVSVAVVKMGENGVFFATKEESAYVPPYRVDVVDTVAAGDAFGAGLSLALAEGKSLHEAVKYGAAAGAMAITRRGAQPAMPSHQDVDALLARFR
jgi:ribokinase